MEAAKVKSTSGWFRNIFRKAVPEQKFDPGRRHMLGLGVAAGAALLLAGCGPDVPAVEDNTCKTIDDFEDGNLAAEAVGGTWAALPGSRIVTTSPTLRIEGRGPGEIGVELNIDMSSAYPNNYIGDWDTIFMDIKVGRLDNPDAYFEGGVHILMESSYSMGENQTETTFPVSAWMDLNQFSTQSLYYRLEDPIQSPKLIKKLKIALIVTEASDFFMEIDNVRICRTQP